MTSSVTINAHPAKSSKGEDLHVEITEYNNDEVVGTKNLISGESYTCYVYEGRSVTITEKV